MKNWELILSEAGIEVPDEKREVLRNAFVANYRTIEDYNNVKAKRDEYSQSLSQVQAQLEGFKEVNVDDLKNQITTLTNTLETERTNRQNEDIKRDLIGRIDAFLNATENGKRKREFVNSITEKSIRESIVAEYDKPESKGRSIEEVFEALTKDADGNQIPNILVSDPKRKARFTAPNGNDGTGGSQLSLKNMTLDERIKLKEEDPELYESLRRNR